MRHLQCFGRAFAVVAMLSAAYASSISTCTVECLNGECRQQPSGVYACECERGYTGTQCEINIDDCANVQCDHGVCQDGLGAWTCSCDPGWIGELCETDKNDCLFVECGHGECIDGINQYNCECDIGYEGPFCQTNIDDCALGHECVHGDCVDGIDSYTCDCYLGYRGEHCDINRDDCIGHLCVHGVCVDGINTYTCSCDLGYTGQYCDQNIDDCVGVNCHNGVCVDGINSFTCVCNDGYSGPYCQIADGNSCNNDASNPCNPLRESGLYYYEYPDSAKFIQCSDHGECFVRDCAPGTVWSQDALTCVVGSSNDNSGSGGNSCNNDASNPCNPLRVSGLYYYEYPNTAKFIQCSDHGECFVRDCAPGTVWSQDALTCVFGTPEDISDGSDGYTCDGDNPCNPLLVANQYYYTHVDSSKFVQCDAWGQCFEMPCGPGTRWNQDVLTCVHA